jgi:hypothetical protein
MREAGGGADGARLRALIVILWRPHPARLIREGGSLQRSTGAVDQIRETGGRAPVHRTGSRWPGLFTRPTPDGDEEHPGGVMMRGMHAGTSSGPVPRQRRRRASHQRPVAFVSSVRPSHRFGPWVRLQQVLFELVAGLDSELAECFA